MAQFDDVISRNIAALTASSCDKRTEKAEMDRREQESLRKLRHLADKSHQQLVGNYKRNCLNLALFRHKYSEENQKTLAQHLDSIHSLIQMKENSDALFAKAEARIEAFIAP